MPTTLHTLLGDYPVTHALRSGALASPDLVVTFEDLKPVNRGFKRMVRNLEFDVAELAIVTYLVARAHGKPLVLLPAVVHARFQHPLIVYNAERGALRPEELPGKRVGVRSYSVTTGAWIRGILDDTYGVDARTITWVTFEDPHVAEFRDPPNVERAAPGKALVDMLLAGEIDAAIVGEAQADPRIRTLIPDPAAAAAAWQAKHGAIQINHMIAVKESFSRSHPEVVREYYRLLGESRRLAGSPAINPFGVEANRRNLEVAIDTVFRGRLIPRRFAVDELFDDVTRID